MSERSASTPMPLLASAEEREPLLATAHVLFREVDAAVHAYLEVLTANPDWEDDRVEAELVRRGVNAGLAEDCVVFVPMAWGRDVAESLGLECSPVFRLHSTTDGGGVERPLTCEFAYAWGRAMLGVYSTAERGSVLSLVAMRSSEVNAVNNALNGGASAADLRGSKMSPTLVYLRRTSQPGPES